MRLRCNSRGASGIPTKASQPLRTHARVEMVRSWRPREIVDPKRKLQIDKLLGAEEYGVLSTYYLLYCPMLPMTP
jgi:hypothetical protein